MEIPVIKLVVKTNSMQFEDKRIEAQASWNIKELKGKLSELYPTSTEEQKLIYSGKLLSDNSILKDILREYEGQEAHTVHLVFTPKANKSSNSRQSAFPETSSSRSSTTTMNNSNNELRQRQVVPPSTREEAPRVQQTTATTTTTIPGNYNAQQINASNLLAQHYAMQAWMHQAYTNYMSQVASYYEQNQQQIPQNFAYLPPQMPYLPTSQTSSSMPANVDAAPEVNIPQPPQPQQPVAEAEQRRFPNIVQEEQENRDWLDILYSMSRLIILLCLVYFYSSPLRCIGVILIGVLIYLYHVYKQNQNRLNNNNTIRVNLNNVNQPAAAAPAAQDDAAVPRRLDFDDEENSENDGVRTAAVIPEEPQVPFATVFKTFVISFFSSIIPEAPAL